ncbi:class I SAM-dependent methyltransferase [Pseudarthrobacter sp. PS3-L1]|uniref:class I SAM-dependent methyltransferase n=1 Tax=Pseudarthrobacter sp. PS3-L1 TaxID=3046207 RepID=UPI0024BAC383|nr:class I SAM-dependent methyltransferase [Pseudarthrobacter sp. PS3-L1]MDJ0320030.1 class I SAM-dependent methyltransferase [Pseudarthrobacter sp. PS3-L1]
MSGFSADWLALREPADHAARSLPVATALREHFASHRSIRVVDLGCGAGSNLRGTFHLLPDRQRWTLVDYDPALLSAARDVLANWADEARDDGESLLVRKDGKLLAISFRQADLTVDLDSVLTADPTPDLVSAAALFDLVSEGWLDTFTAALRDAGIPLYTVLTYDGLQEWVPSHEGDAAILSGFNAHQQTDKGFGRAAGPRAAEGLAQRLQAAGFTVTTGSSPWELESGALAVELARGIAEAAAEAGAVTPGEAQAWFDARDTTERATIGHLDVLALPTP